VPDDDDDDDDVICAGLKAVKLVGRDIFGVWMQEELCNIEYVGWTSDIGRLKKVFGRLRLRRDKPADLR
jgi:hypothetical protein